MTIDRLRKILSASRKKRLEAAGLLIDHVSFPCVEASADTRGFPLAAPLTEFDLIAERGKLYNMGLSRGKEKRLQ